MMIRAVVCTCLLAAATTAAAAQEGRPGNDEARHVIRPATGGYVVAGHAASTDTGQDVLLTRLDHAGRTVWSRTLGDDGDEIGFVVREVADGYVVAGFGTRPERDEQRALLMRTDTLGQPLWQRWLDTGSNARATDVRVLADGDLVLVGQVQTAHDSLDAVVMRTDSSGLIRWMRTLGGSGTDRGFYVDVTPDGRIALAGLTTSAPSSEADLLVALLDEDGSLLWRRHYGGAGYQTSHSISALDDGSLLVTGYGIAPGGSDNDALVMKVSAHGELLRHTSFGGTGDDHVLAAVVSDGDVFITGYTRSFDASGWAGFLARLRPDGTLRWLAAHDAPGDQAPGSLVVDGDAVVIVGYERLSAETGRDVMVRMSDVDGRGFTRRSDARSAVHR